MHAFPYNMPSNIFDYVTCSDVFRMTGMTIAKTCSFYQRHHNRI